MDEREVSELNFKIGVLEKRLRHLLQSKLIASFDEREPMTGKYKRDINEADRLIELPRKAKEEAKRMTHTIKIKASYATAISEGRKNFEIRKNDRGYNAGDIVHFIVISDWAYEAGPPYTSPGTYLDHPLNAMAFEITYVYSGPWIEKDYVVFGIRPIAKKEAEK